MKKVLKYSFLTVLLLALLLVAGFAFCNHFITWQAKGRLYDDVESIPHREVGLLLCAPPFDYYDKENKFCTTRIDAAYKLYQAGKVDRILVSGCTDMYKGSVEVNFMRDSLVALGVPSDCIVMDGYGIRTLDSVVRMHDVYGVESCTLISQKFHNERALFIARGKKLQFKEPLIGFNAEDPELTPVVEGDLSREKYARMKAWLDILKNAEPANMEVFQY